MSGQIENGKGGLVGGDKKVLGELTNKNPFVVIEELLSEKWSLKCSMEFPEIFKRINLETLNKEEQVQYYYLFGKYNGKYLFDETVEKDSYTKAVAINEVNTMYSRYAKYKLAMIIKNGDGSKEDIQKLLEESAGNDFVKPYLDLAELYFYDIYCGRHSANLSESEAMSILDKVGEYAQMVLTFKKGCDERDLKAAEGIISKVEEFKKDREGVRKRVEEETKRMQEEEKRKLEEEEMPKKGIGLFNCETVTELWEKELFLPKFMVRLYQKRFGIYGEEEKEADRMEDYSRSEACLGETNPY
jgi:hypothetical protein